MTRFFTFRRQVPRPKPGWTVDFLKGRGFYLRRKPQPKPPAVMAAARPTNPFSSVFAGKGLFTTSDASTASGHPCDWVALQMDPEGDERPVIHNNPARIYYWQARPSHDIHDIVAAANAKSVPYIAQAENQQELDVALSLHLTVPKALVGNPTSWSKEGFEEANRQGWDLILEWYWNAHPWERSPDAAHYPRFVNVCFGIYSETDVPQIPLANYRTVWRSGSYSIWKAEAMTDADWAVFDA